MQPMILGYGSSKRLRHRPLPSGISPVPKKYPFLNLQVAILLGEKRG
jgi:hypothetical protein